MSATPTAALVEEAEKLSQRATPGPWRVGTVHAAEEVWAAYPDGLAGLASERLLLRLNPNFTSEQDTAFIARARTLVPELAAALRRAKAERDAQHAEVLRLTGELEALATKTGDVEWREDAAVKVVKMRGRQIAELTATRDLLTAENARLQKEHNAYVQRLSADALQVASKYQRDLDEARAQIATLELLRRGGK